MRESIYAVLAIRACIGRVASVDCPLPAHSSSQEGNDAKSRPPFVSRRECELPRARLASANVSLDERQLFPFFFAFWNLPASPMNARGKTFLGFVRLTPYMAHRSKRFLRTPSNCKHSLDRSIREPSSPLLCCLRLLIGFGDLRAAKANSRARAGLSNGVERREELAGRETI